MKAHYEKVLHNDTSIAAFEREVPEFPFYWHYHPEFELTLILDSSGQRLVGDSIADYGPGDLVLLGPDLPHSWRSGPVKARAQKIHRAIVFQFRRDSLGDQFFALKELRPVAALLERSACGLEFGHTQRGIEAAQKLKEFHQLLPAQRLLLLVSVLLLLADETNAHKLSTYPVQPIYREKDQKRIEAICRYLHEHFEEPINFAGMAERFHMDQASLCRFFKRATGRTMTTYLNEYRLGAASQLILQTDASLLEIAFQVGFGNYANFYRQFRQIKGCSPRALRQTFPMTNE
jgi:AraC-like DNA-binding protein